MHDTIYVRLTQTSSWWESSPLMIVAGTLLGVIFTSWVSLRIARNQISANVISIARQHWIGDVRKIVNKFLKTARVMFVHMRNSSVDPHEYKSDAKRLGELNSMLKLYLHPDNNTHMKLHTTIREIIHIIGEDDNIATINETELEAQARALGKLIHKAIQESHEVFEAEIKLIKKFK